MQDLVTSIIRTVVPLIVGAVLAFLASQGIEPVDASFAANLTAFLTFLFSALYYIVVRLVAKKFPRFEWLLGSPAKPTYKG